MAQQPRLQAEAASMAQPGGILVVIHDFMARSADEIRLSKGERVELIERDDDFGDGWYLGRHLQTGQTGLFPEVYTKMAPKGTLAAQQNRTAAPRSPDPRTIAAQRAASTPLPGSSIQPQPHSPPANMHQMTHPSIQVTQSSQHSTPQLSAASSSGAYPAGYNSYGANAPVAPNTPSAVQQAGSGAATKGSSNVMQDTLGVIDEHITDMRKSGRSVSPAARRRATTDSASEYSMTLPSDTHSQISYIQGEETEEEESGKLTAKEVKRWSAGKMANYLEGAGVEKSHCDVFREQEFSGEVVLGLDQSSIFLKELELGPIGRRLRTWQKIRALQDEVAPPKPSQTLKISESSRPESRRASNSSAAVLQRAPHSVDKLPGHDETVQQTPTQTYLPSHAGRQENNTASALSRISASASQSPRPSAASIRSLGHTRRQSSIDQALNKSNAGTPAQSSHSKQPSFDRNWNMGSLHTEQNGVPRPVSSAHGHSLSSDRTMFEKRASQLSLNTQPSTAHDTDHGYQSAVEGEATRPSRRVLRKRDADHSRASSYETGANRFSFFRRSRASSVTRTPPISGPTAAVHTASGADLTKDKRRLSGAPSEATTATSGTAGASTADFKDAFSDPREVPDRAATPKSARKGLRAISDAVTGREKAAQHPTYGESLSPTTDVSTPQSPSSGTPSGKSHSLDNEDANSGPHSTPIGQPAPKKRKSKKETTAYTRGLEKKSPQEQMIGADYSGWMKKKSSNLVTNWKPRLFVLRGKRLSYYYSESDTQERGLIDISGHRVLPANKERLTGLHASITKATSSPTAPQNANAFAPNVTASPVKDEETDRNSSILTTPVSATGTVAPEISDGQGFIFKLAPPRAGLSRGVNFTKPTVHYFAVPSVEVGRLWMAALMKATIDRDEAVQVITTYQQKTISLEKARARKERPPALKSLDDGDEPTAGGASEDGSVTLEKVDEDDLEEERAESAMSEQSSKKVEEPMTDQMREVTDLSPLTNRGSMSPRHEKKNSRNSGTSRTSGWSGGRKRSESTDGLGISGVSNGGVKEKPELLADMKKAGLW